MIITGLALQNFRLHKNYILKFKAQTTVIVGSNAIGKTSIIEALALLSTGNSFRAGKVEEMILFDADLARVKGVIIDGVVDKMDEAGGNVESKKKVKEEPKTAKDLPTDEVEVMLTRGLVNGKKTQHRLFTVNGVRRRKKDAAGKFHAVVFRPEDMRLIEGSPSRRRSFIDTVLALLYIDYEVSLKNYDQTLRRRNKLLQQIRDGKQPRTVLNYWDLNLVKYGTVLQNYRQKFLETFAQVDFPVDFTVEYEPSLISTEILEKYIEKECIVGHTLIGPHKDDFFVFLQAKDKFISKNDDKKSSGKDNKTKPTKKTLKLRLDTYGSRGQQRLGVLWLKFCELEFLKKQSDKNTLLLLDDILSELDDDSKALALSVLKNYQAVVTTTEPSVLAEIEQASDNIEVIYL